MKYAGIGSRETPHETMMIMRDVAGKLECHDWILRTGGAEGADTAFIDGLIQFPYVELVEVYLPWRGYQGWYDAMAGDGKCYPDPSSESFDMAAQYHPRWQYLKQGAKKLHARNMHIMLGWTLDDPVDRVICWTPGGKVTGGTGQALRVALDLEIPIINLANEPDRQLILDAISTDNFDGI